MTPHQLQLLEILGAHHDLGATQREAVRAILAERATCLEHLSDLTSLLEQTEDYIPGTDSYTTGEVAKLFVRTAKGG